MNFTLVLFCLFLISGFLLLFIPHAILQSRNYVQFTFFFLLDAFSFFFFFFVAPSSFAFILSFSNIRSFTTNSFIHSHEKDVDFHSDAFNPLIENLVQLNMTPSIPVEQSACARFENIQELVWLRNTDEKKNHREKEKWKKFTLPNLYGAVYTKSTGSWLVFLLFLFSLWKLSDFFFDNCFSCNHWKYE